MFASPLPPLRRAALVLVIALLAVGAGAQGTQAQIGAAFPGITIQPASYPYSLGKATVALRGYDGALGINPATIGQDGHVQVGSQLGGAPGPVYGSPWGSQLASEAWIGTPSATVKTGRWAAGLQYKRFLFRRFEVRAANGTVLRVIDEYEASVKAGAAYDLSPHWTVGAAVSYLQGQLADLSPDASTPMGAFEAASTATVALDLGAHYQRGVHLGRVPLQIAGGLALTNFGPNVTYSDDEPGDQSLPTRLRLGSALQGATPGSWQTRPFLSAGLYGALSKQMTARRPRTAPDGTMYSDAYGPFAALIETWTATGVGGPSGEPESLSLGEQLVLHAGAELEVLDVASFRWGRFHEDEANGGRQYTTYGLGLDLYYVRLDRAWTGAIADDSPPTLQNDFWRVTVRVPLSASERNFWPALIRALGA